MEEDAAAPEQSPMTISSPSVWKAIAVVLAVILAAVIYLPSGFCIRPDEVGIIFFVSSTLITFPPTESEAPSRVAEFLS
jgi:hypothetical protein